MHKNWYHK